MIPPSFFLDCPAGCGRLRISEADVRRFGMTMDGRLVLSWSADGLRVRCPNCKADLSGFEPHQIKMRALSKRQFKIHPGDIWFCIPGCVTAVETECNCPCGGMCHGIGYATRNEWNQIVREGSGCPGHPLDELKAARQLAGVAGK